MNSWVYQQLCILGNFGNFVSSSIGWVFSKPFRWRLILSEIHFVGNQSLALILLTSGFTGAVFAYQSWIALRIVGTESLMGMSTCLGLLREMSPVLTAIVVAGRAGAAMAAKLGIMRVSEQIDALELMGVSPKQYLIGPKILATTISLPLLCAVFSLMGNFGAYFVGTFVCGVDGAIYIQNLKAGTYPWDLYHGLIKATFFGLMLSSVSCYKGFQAKNGAEGVGKATNESVVYSIAIILIFDYFLTTIIPTGLRTEV